MELNKLAFVAQPRSPWQVFDLTQLVVKQNFFSLVKIYLATMLPIALVSLLCFSISTTSLLVWWCKPLFERPLLTYLSKQCFHQPCTTWQALKSLKQLGIVNIIKMLTLYRFSPNRAYLSPVEQLEKQAGIAAISRKNLLKTRIKHKQTLWMLLCVHLEMLLTLVLLLIAFNFVPAGISFDSQFFQNALSNHTAELIYLISYLISITIIAPYFVTGGFLMYLNARIQLEAWDIELTFKRIASRFSSVAVLAFILVLTMTTPQPSYATEMTQTSNDYSEKLQKIKADVESIYEENQLIEKQTTWKPITKEEQTDLPSWLKTIKAFFALLAKLGPLLGYLMWIIVGFLVYWVVKQLYLSRGKWFSRYVQTTSTDNAPQLPLFFADAPQQHWPDDLLAAAKQALAKEHYRQALMYLLNFALQLAEQKSAFHCQKSMTEKECEQALLAVLPNEQHPLYQHLFLCWIQQAWAHKKVTHQQIKQLIDDFTQLAGEPLHE